MHHDQDRKQLRVYLAMYSRYLVLDGDIPVFISQWCLFSRLLSPQDSRSQPFVAASLHPLPPPHFTASDYIHSFIQSLAILGPLTIVLSCVVARCGVGRMGGADVDYWVDTIESVCRYLHSHHNNGHGPWPFPLLMYVQCWIVYCTIVIQQLWGACHTDLWLYEVHHMVNTIYGRYLFWLSCSHYRWNITIIEMREDISCPFPSVFISLYLDGLGV